MTTVGISKHRPLGEFPVNVIWSVLVLVGVYVLLTLITDISAVKMTTVLGVSLPAGSILYAVSFTWRDLIHKRLGIQWTRRVILMGAGVNIGMAVWFAISSYLPAASFWKNQAAFVAILGVMPRVTAASIFTEVVAELADTQVYHWTEHRFRGRWQFMRVILSNAVSCPVDATLFAVTAFAGTMPTAGLLSIIWGGMLFKLALGYLVIPLIYLVPERKITVDIAALA